jgi:hypothetical protein
MIRPVSPHHRGTLRVFAYSMAEQSRHTTYLVALAALIEVIPRAAYAHKLPTVGRLLTYGQATQCRDLFLLTHRPAHAASPSRALPARPYASRGCHQHAPLCGAGRSRGRIKDVKRWQRRFGARGQPYQGHVAEQRCRRNARHGALPPFLAPWPWFCPLLTSKDRGYG